MDNDGSENVYFCRNLSEGLREKMSVFGKKKTAEQQTQAKLQSYLMPTQGHIDDMVGALVKHAKDGDKKVHPMQ